jgi:tyrosinase
MATSHATRAPVAGPLVPALRVRADAEQSDLDALANAYGTMQSREENDSKSWIYWSEFHGYNRNDCWHQGWQGGRKFPYDLFLPWHRAYLMYFELEEAQFGGPPLPWWDWTSAASHRTGVPPAFAQKPSLASGPVPRGLRTNPPRTTRNPEAPDELPSVEKVEQILALPSFTDFSSQLQGVHNQVHGWCRGDMATVTASAFDPIFWAHHSMIDRLWYLWQVQHGVDNIPPNYLSLVLAPWNLTVKDVLDVDTLGYTYGVSRVLVPATDLTTTPLG